MRAQTPSPEVHVKIALAALVLFASPAFAKAKHHCVNSDGTEVSGTQTKKQCKKAGGKWKKMKASDMSSTTATPPPK